MPLNLAALNRKLAAIRAKPFDDIVAKRVHLPFVGTDYTREQLVAWLEKRAALIEQVRDGAYTDAQIESYIVARYQEIGPSDKRIADDLRAGVEFNLDGASSAAAFETLVLIVLAKFAVRPD